MNLRKMIHCQKGEGEVIGVIALLGLIVALLFAKFPDRDAGSLLVINLDEELKRLIFTIEETNDAGQHIVYEFVFYQNGDFLSGKRTTDWIEASGSVKMPRKAVDTLDYEQTMEILSKYKEDILNLNNEIINEFKYNVFPTTGQ